MKRILSVFLALVIVFSLSACGNSNQDSAYVNNNEDSAYVNSNEDVIVGNWYNVEGDWLEVLSNNTFLYYPVSKNGEDKVNGQWRKSETEGGYEFYNDENEDFRETIFFVVNDEFGTYIASPSLMTSLDDGCFRRKTGDGSAS